NCDRTRHREPRGGRQAALGERESDPASAIGRVLTGGRGMLEQRRDARGRSSAANCWPSSQWRSHGRRADWDDTNSTSWLGATGKDHTRRSTTWNVQRGVRYAAAGGEGTGVLPGDAVVR